MAIRSLIDAAKHINLGAEASYKRRVLAAGAWSIGGYGISLGIRFGSNLLMTHLLRPEYFGIMAIATVFMVGLVMITDMGLGQNVVRSKRGDQVQFLNTAWRMQILQGVLLSCSAASFGLAVSMVSSGNGTKDSVYNDPLLPQVIAALSVGLLIGGFLSTKWLEANRNLLLRRITQIELISQLVGLFCMLSLVYFDRTIWPLVLASLAAISTRVVLSHAWLPGTNNRWLWDSDAAREIFSFGKWVFASSVLGFLATNADRLILGVLVDTAVLGVFAIAFLIFSSLEQAMIKVISNVSLPALSRIVREQPRALQRSYYRIQIAVACAAYFCAAFVFVSGPPIIALMYDARYHQAGQMLQVLSLSLLVLPLQIAVQAFLALGRPELHSQALLVRLLVLLVAMPSGFYLSGAIGAIWGGVVAQFASSGILVFYSVKTGIFDWRKEVVSFAAIPAGFIFALAVDRCINMLRV